MPSPRVFISSTYVDLQDARSVVESFFTSLTYETVTMERGGIHYDHNRPIDESCYEAVKDCDIMILILGGRYGSPTSKDANLKIKKYNSITKQEYETAINENIPVFTFIKNSVYNEHYIYINQLPKYRQNYIPRFVDNVLIFSLIQEIRSLNNNNIIIQYETVDEILRYLKKANADLVHSAIKSRKQVDKTISQDVFINAYKLYYFRRSKSLSLTSLARIVGIKRNFLISLEKIKDNENNGTIFRKCNFDILLKIEEALDCKKKLEVGQEDDQLSMFLQYYYANREKKAIVTNPKTIDNPHYLFPTKCVIFDFDGTLSKQLDRTSWELIWEELGYTIEDCARLHRQYSNKSISHEEWCKETCEMFNAKSINPNTLKEVSKKIELMPGVRDVVNVLLDAQIELHILSGSILEIINEVLGDLNTKFTHIQANSFKFTANTLSYIESTKYDFEGKAEYINRIMKQRNYATTDVLFIGNSSNDRWASRSGVRTLCVNPHFTDGNDEKEWLYCKRELLDMKEVLPYLNFR
ncbi:MAG: HAD-IB family phosphatase [Saprospiraceae bacterium]